MTSQMEFEFYKRVGEALTRERTRRKLTITAVAKMAGDQFITVKRIEEGHRFSFHHAYWLVELFGIDVTAIARELKGEARNGTAKVEDFI